MIIDAATVLLLRPGTDGPEVFMVRRHGKSSFMANAWVYPGGRLDEADSREDVVSRVVGLSSDAARERLGIASETRAAGLYLAAIRETFEEAGVLLARTAGSDSEAWIDLTGDAQPRFAAHRERLQRYETSLSVVAAAEDLVFPLDELAFFAHWITPTFEPKRFDTFFFLARAPAHQTPLHDAIETTDGGWTTPGAALDALGAGELWMAPPTIRTLQRLAAFDTIDDAFASTQQNMPACIIPHLSTDGPTPILLLPGDPDYPADDPEYALATPVSGPTRVELTLPV